MHLNKRFAIGIPTINRYDLLKEALQQYAHDFIFHNIYIVDNGYQNIVPEHNVTIMPAHGNYGVAGSWNLLCRTIFEQHDYAILINDDVYWGKHEDQVTEFIEMNGYMDCIASEQHWCNFMLNKRAWMEVGEFDEQFFPAYFEDNDYQYRMRLKRMRYEKADFFNPIVFRNSGSIEKDPSLNQNFVDNESYYISKWGGKPGNERFRTPFNR
jgi:GT2 family glycosyltransferase